MAKNNQPPKIYLTDADIHKHTHKLIKKLRKIKLPKDRTAIVAIARGGLLPAQYVAYALGIRDLFVVNSKVYEGEAKAHGQEISNIFLIDFENFDNFIVIDDIYDSGETMDGVIFALEQISTSFNEDCNFIPAVLHSQKPKKYLKNNGIIYGKAIKPVKGKSPWIVYPWDYLSEEFNNEDC